MPNQLRELYLSVVRIAIQMVLQQIAQQSGRLVDEIQNPVQAIIQEVIGGAWVGNGANKFLDELYSVFVPSCDQIQASCQITTSSILYSVNSVDEADSQVEQLIGNLDSVFRSI